MIQTRTLVVTFVSALVLALLVAFLYLTLNQQPAEPYRAPVRAHR